MPGGFLSLSANGTTAGIVWAVTQQTSGTCSCPVDPVSTFTLECNGGTGQSCWYPENCSALYCDVGGQFFAFDAQTMAQLYVDSVPFYSKMTAPTVANGKVVVSAANAIIVYGLQ